LYGRLNGILVNNEKNSIFNDVFVLYKNYYFKTYRILSKAIAVQETLNK
jgi:hypothetical protein